MSAKIIWTPDMLTSLKTLRAGRVTILDCAETIGVYYAECLRKCQELGLNGRLNRGQHSGPDMHARQFGGRA